MAEATSARELLLRIKQSGADIVLTDIMMPDMTGYEFTIALKKDYPAVKVLALSMSEEGSMIAKMIDVAGVDGFIPKSAGKQELLKAIDALMNGAQYFSAAVLEQYHAYKQQQSGNEVYNLTARELEVIGCIIRYLNNRQIAEQLFISERTVETHRKNIYRKTNTRGEASLVEFVTKHNLPVSQ